MIPMSFNNMLNSITCILIIIFSITIRCFPLIKYGFGIVEYDPFFNFRCLEKINENGISSFFEWYDNTAWYPYGREIGKTSYPGLMIITYIFYKLLAIIHIHIPILYLCSAIPIVYYFVLIIAIFLFCKKNNNHLLALNAISISCLIPGMIHKTSLGFFDYECIGTGLIMLSIYFYSLAIDMNKCTYSIIAAVFTGILGLTWGGHVFLINLIPLVTLTTMFLNGYSYKLCISYNVWFVFSYLLLSNIPCIDQNIIHNITYYFGYGVSLITLFASIYIKFNKSRRKILLILVIVSFITIINFCNTLTASSVASRLFDIFGSKKNQKSLISIIVEHTPSTWTNYVTNCGMILLVCPVGLYQLIISPLNILRISIIVGFIVTLIFSSLMSRVIILFIPFQIIVCAYSLDSLISLSFRKRNIYSIICLFMLCIIGINMNVMLAANKFSDNYLNFEVEGRNGTIISKDHIEVYSWLRSNVPNKLVLSMWDLGYHLSEIGKSWTLNDGNTNNFTHISAVGLAFASNEKRCWEIVRSFDCDYIMVSFGGASGFPFDDIMKFQWMIDSVEQFYPNISSTRYLRNDQTFIVDKHMTKDMMHSALFKLSYYKFRQFQKNKNLERGFDLMRGERIGHIDFNLEKFREIYTSENWILRVYKVMPDPLWNT